MECCYSATHLQTLEITNILCLSEVEQKADIHLSVAWCGRKAKRCLISAGHPPAITLPILTTCQLAEHHLPGQLNREGLRVLPPSAQPLPPHS